MKKLTWTKRAHPIWGERGKEFDIHTLGLKITFPKWQWIEKSGRFDIVGPASCFTVSGEETYELYDRKEKEVIDNYATLGEAQSAARGMQSE